MKIKQCCCHCNCQNEAGEHLALFSRLTYHISQSLNICEQFFRENRMSYEASTRSNRAGSGAFPPRAETSPIDSSKYISCTSSSSVLAICPRCELHTRLHISSVLSVRASAALRQGSVSNYMETLTVLMEGGWETGWTRKIEPVSRSKTRNCSISQPCGARL